MMGLYYCNRCHGELVSCECPEVDQLDDDYTPEPEYLCEDIDDAQVRFVIDHNGVGRIEVHNGWFR